jgi:hypothetical protein
MSDDFPADLAYRDILRISHARRPVIITSYDMMLM